MNWFTKPLGYRGEMRAAILVGLLLGWLVSLFAAPYLIGVNQKADIQPKLTVYMQHCQDITARKK